MEKSASVVHFEIPVSKLDRAKKFYEEAFRWMFNPVPEMDYLLVTTTPSDENGMPKEKGAINGGFMKRTGPVKHPVITIDVEDIDISLEKIKQAGGKVAIEKRAVGKMGFSAYFTDTEGNLIGLWQNAMPR